MSFLLAALAIAVGSLTPGAGSSSSGSGALLDPSVSAPRQLPIELITSTGERAYARATGRAAKPLPVGTATTVRILYRGSAHSRRVVSLSHRGSSNVVAHAGLANGQAGWRLPAVSPGSYTLVVSVGSLHGVFSLLLGRVRQGLGTSSSAGSPRDGSHRAGSRVP